MYDEHRDHFHQTSGRRPSRGRRRFDDDDEPAPLSRFRRPSEPAESDSWTSADADRPETGDAWSSWDQAVQGPAPHPEWLVTELAAVDTELGILKTGKEADVHLVRRGVPGTDRSCLLAVKRYRDPDHRMFHRDAGYLEGRRVHRSRETRAMRTRTAFGRQLIAGQWANAEFAALSRLWQLGAEHGGLLVPYPVQLLGTELMLEFVGDAEQGLAAPRLAQLRPEPDLLVGLWEQLVSALTLLARAGYAHGDLSPYNLLVDGDRLVLIDLPQVVDVVGNPRGPEFLARDVRVVCDWFVAHGLPAGLADPDTLTRELLGAAGVR